VATMASAGQRQVCPRCGSYHPVQFFMRLRHLAQLVNPFQLGREIELANFRPFCPIRRK
jgi:hypothetical protein